MNRRITVWGLGSRIVLASVVTLATALPTHAQGLSVDELLARALAPQRFALAPHHRLPYELTADFSATLLLQVRDGVWTADAAGLFREWQGMGERTAQHRVTIEQLHLPLLLRPFAGFLRHEVEERVARLSSDSPDFHAHDFFIVDPQPGNLYVVAAVHRAIVSEAMDRYKASANKGDPATRRLVARWLYSSPLMRTWIVRPGPPYALAATVDEAGLVHTLTAFYDWGQTSTKITYALLNGDPIWMRVVSEITGEIPHVGSVHGQLSLRFTNYWLD